MSAIALNSQVATIREVATKQASDLRRGWSISSTSASDRKYASPVSVSSEGSSLPSVISATLS